MITTTTTIQKVSTIKVAKPVPVVPAATPKSILTPVVPDSEPPKPVSGFGPVKEFDPAQAESPPAPPTPVPAPSASSHAPTEPGGSSLVSYRVPQSPITGRAIPPVPPAVPLDLPAQPAAAPGLAHLSPLPNPRDSALLRTSINEVKAAVARFPTALVMPTPIVVMPPAAPKAKRQTILGRALDRLHSGKKGDVPQAPRP